MWSSVIQQVPALAIFAGLMAFIVKKFMEYMTFRDELIKDISNHCHEVQGKATQAMVDNNKVLTELTRAVDELRKHNGNRVNA